MSWEILEEEFPAMAKPGFEKRNRKIAYRVTI
jgi:hypothetical protein